MLVRLSKEHPGAYIKVELPSGWVRIDKRGAIVDDAYASIVAQNKWLVFDGMPRAAPVKTVEAPEVVDAEKTVKMSKGILKK